MESAGADRVRVPMGAHHMAAESSPNASGGGQGGSKVNTSQQGGGGGVEELKKWNGKGGWAATASQISRLWETLLKKV